MSKTAVALMSEAKKLIPGGVNSATRNFGAPYAFREAKGAHLIDYEGRRYVD